MIHLILDAIIIFIITPSMVSAVVAVVLFNAHKQLHFKLVGVAKSAEAL